MSDTSSAPTFVEPELPAYAPEDSTSERRFRVAVGVPKAMLSLGKEPEDIGFKGITLATEHHLLIDITKAANWHVGENTTLFFTKDVYAYADNWAQNSKGEHSVASGSRAVYVAGAGYGDNAPINSGEEPEPRGYNGLDLEELAEGWTEPTVAFEKSLHQTLKDQLGALGLSVPADARMSNGYITCLTGGSETNPVSRLLGKVTNLLDRAERLTARPELVPVVGPLLGKIKDTRALANDVKDTVEAAEGLKANAEDLQKNVKSGTGKLGEEQGKLYEDDKVDPAKGNTGKGTKENLGGGLKQADAGLKFATEDAPDSVLKPTRKFIAQVNDVAGNLQKISEAASNALGFRNPTKAAIGVLGKEGVTLASGEKIVGVAQGGFYFVSAPPADDAGGTMAEKVKKYFAPLTPTASTMKELISGAVEEPQVPATPDFTVRVDGQFDAVSKGHVLLAAAGEKSNARVGAQNAAELFAKKAVALGAREGTAELLGKYITLGVPPRAKAAADMRDLAMVLKKAEATAAKTAATTALATAKAALVAATTKLNVARAAVVASVAAGTTATVAAAGATQGQAGGSRATGIAATASAGAFALTTFALDQAYDAWLEAKKKVEQAEATLAEATALATIADTNHGLSGKGSLAAFECDSDATKQKATQKVQVWALAEVQVESADKLTLHGKTVTVGEFDPGTGALTTDAVNVKSKQATVEATEKVTLKVGDFTVVLETSGVTVGKSGGPEIKLTTSDATVTVGSCSVKVDNSGVNITGTNVKITGNAGISLS